MTQAPVRNRAIADWVYDAVVEKMVSGELSPGQPVPVAPLAQQLGVSRTPVREATQRLAIEGLMEHDINQKPVIRQFTAADVAEIFAMRMLLEGQSAYEAATMLDQMAINELVTMGEEIAGAAEIDEAWLRQWADYDDYFHDKISEASENSLLIDDIRRHRLIHRVLNLKILEPAGVKIAVQEHLAIIYAIKDRNPDEARRLMRHHIREWKTYFTQNYKP